MADKQRIKDIGEVFTPQHIVNDMVDLLPELTAATTVLEPSVGEGIFLCEILRRKLHQNLTGPAQNLTGLPDQLGLTTRALQSLYGVDIMLDNVRKTRENLLKICRETIDFPSFQNLESLLVEILQNNIRWGDTLACVEAEIEYHNKPQLLFLKDKGVAVCELKFYDYQTSTWQNYSDFFKDDEAQVAEINRQRREYIKIEPLKQPVIIKPKQPVAHQSVLFDFPDTPDLFNSLNV